MTCVERISKRLARDGSSCNSPIFSILFEKSVEASSGETNYYAVSDRTWSVIRSPFVAEGVKERGRERRCQSDTVVS